MITKVTDQARQRLLEVIPLILANESSCNMSRWVDTPNFLIEQLKPKLCNTELCVGGWLVFKEFGGDEEALRKLYENEADIESKAYKLLEIAEDEERVGLFNTERWPRALERMYTAAPEAQRASVMALAIGLFIESPLSFQQESGWFDDNGHELADRREW